jgi:hypothetical protein
MSSPRAIQIVLLSLAILAASWQLRRHLEQGRALSAMQAQLLSASDSFESRKMSFSALERQSAELQEAERRAGNETLLALMRERANTTRTALDAAAQAHCVGNALARVLDNPDQQDVERESRRIEMRAGLGTLFKLLNASPEQMNAYIDLSLDDEQRKSERMSALLQGRLTVEQALRQRDSDDLEVENRRREILGDKGAEFINGIGDGMRNDEAKRLLKLIQENMSGNELSPEQSDRLQGLIKSELVEIHMDDTDLFRPVDEWGRVFGEHQEKVLLAAAGFLTSAQLDTLKGLAAYDLAERQKQNALKRGALGIK